MAHMRQSDSRCTSFSIDVEWGADPAVSVAVACGSLYNGVRECGRIVDLDEEVEASSYVPSEENEDNVTEHEHVRKNISSSCS